MSGPPAVVLDTTVVSNFASTDSLVWLEGSLPNPIVPRAVRDELRQGLEHGHSDLSLALSFVGSSGVTVQDAQSDISFDTLGPGESAALSLTETVGGVLATDDTRARTVARDRDVPVTGSIGLLVRGIVRGELEIETADQWLQCWIEKRRYYAPVDHVEEALPNGDDGA